MDKIMASANTNSPKSFSIGSLKPTGIKIRATDKITGKEVTSGIQFDNSRMEIMALPNLEIIVYKDGG